MALQKQITTSRLALVLEDTATVLTRIDSLPAELRAHVSAAWLERLRGAEPNPWTHGFNIIERASGVPIGSCGFKGPPDERMTVEIGYEIAEGHRGQGYAKEAAVALVALAEDSGVAQVCAHTLPEKGPSTSVLASIGFDCVGEVTDPEDGLVWRWQRSLLKG